MENAAQRMPLPSQAIVEARALALAHDFANSTNLDEQNMDRGYHIGSGIVKDTGEKCDQFHPGDEVIFAIGTNTDKLGLDAAAVFTSQLMTTDSDLIIKKPRTLSFAQAVCLADAFFPALSTVSKALGITSDSLMEQDSSQQDHGAILLFNSTSLIGSIMLQILRALRPKLFILTTLGPFQAEMDEDSLGAISVDQILLGASYAIEDEAEDLVEHLRAALNEEVESGVDCIIDPTGNLAERMQELQELMASPHTTLVDVQGKIAVAGPAMTDMPPAESSREWIVQTVAVLARLLGNDGLQFARYLSIDQYRDKLLEQDLQRRYNNLCPIEMLTS